MQFSLSLSPTAPQAFAGHHWNCHPGPGTVPVVVTPFIGALLDGRQSHGERDFSVHPLPHVPLLARLQRTAAAIADHTQLRLGHGRHSQDQLVDGFAKPHLDRFLRRPV